VEAKWNHQHLTKLVIFSLSGVFHHQPARWDIPVKMLRPLSQLILSVLSASCVPDGFPGSKGRPS
jgi:hypothetical protein